MSFKTGLQYKKNNNNYRLESNDDQATTFQATGVHVDVAFFFSPSVSSSIVKLKFWVATRGFVGIFRIRKSLERS
jgi:hypothetical protein